MTAASTQQAAAEAAAEKNQAVQANGSSKPRRKDFFQTIVVASNGQVVPESKWQPLVKDVPATSQRKIAKELKKHNMQPVPIFLNEKYEEAKNSFYKSLHETSKTERAGMVQSICDELGVKKTRHIDASIRALLPLFKGTPVKQQHAAFKGIIKSIAASGVLADWEKREQARTERKAAKAKTAGTGRGRGRKKSSDAQSASQTTH